MVRIGILVGISVLIIVTATLFVPLNLLRESGYEHLVNEVQQSSHALVSKIEADLRQGEELANVCAYLLSSNDKSPCTRAQAIELIKNALSGYPSVIGVGLAYEANAFDGADSLYIGVAGNNFQGRFIPYIDKDIHGVAHLDDTCYSHIKTDSDSWYFATITSGKAFISELYTTKVFERPRVPVFTLAQPIFRGNKTIGVMSVDVELERVLEWIHNSHFNGNAIVSFYSPQGHLIASSHPESDVPETFDWRTLTSKEIEDLRSRESVLHEEGDVIHYVIPFYFDSCENPLLLSIDLNKSDAIAAVYQSLSLYLWVGVLLTLTLILIVLFVMRKQLRPITLLANRIEALAEGHLSTQRIGFEEKGDETGLISRSYMRMVEQLQGIIQNIEQLSLELNSSSEHISNSANEVACAAETEASSTDEVLSQCTSVLNVCKNDVTIADKTSTAIAHAQTQLKELAEGIVKTSNTLNEMVNREMLLAEVATQTNILALNAAVSAARAGIKGRGFAVIASEVRTLAERSAEIVDGIQALRSTSLAVSEASLQELERLQSVMGTLITKMGGLNENSHHVTDSIQQIEEAIVNLSNYANSNAHAASSLSDASVEIVSHVKKLRNEVGYFKLDVAK